MGSPFRDWKRAVGAPEDPVATDVSSSWSLISLWKAIYQKISDGTLATSIADAADSRIKIATAAAMAQGNSLISRARSAANTALAAAHQAEGFRAFSSTVVSQCAQFLRQARVAKVAAQLAATNAATSETNAAASASLAAIERAAANFTAGQAMFGQRVKKDRVAAAASATAAAASAATIAPENLVLGVQIFS